MAEPIKYHPEAQTRESARDQLDELLQTLAESGTLRLAKDLIARIGPVADVLASRLETQPGRNMLGNLTLLGTALSRLSPDELQVLIGAALSGFHAAARFSRQKPPGLLQLLLVLRSENVRRTAVAGLAFLYATGELLRPENERHTALVRD